MVPRAAHAKAAELRQRAELTALPAKGLIGLPSWQASVFYDADGANKLCLAYVLALDVSTVKW